MMNGCCQLKKSKESIIYCAIVRVIEGQSRQHDHQTSIEGWVVKKMEVSKLYNSAKMRMLTWGTGKTTSHMKRYLSTESRHKRPKNFDNENLMC